MKEQILKSSTAVCTWTSHSANEELVVVTAKFGNNPPVRKIVLTKKVREAGIEEGEEFLGTEVVYGNSLPIGSGCKRSFLVEKMNPDAQKEDVEVMAETDDIFSDPYWKGDN